MAEPHVISALVRRYRMTMGALHKAEADAAACREALVHLDAVLRMFREDWNAEGLGRIGPKASSRWPVRGGGIRTALTVLRQASEPLTTHEIVRRCYAIHGMPEPDQATLRAAAGPLHKGLRNREGVVAHAGTPKRWSLAE